MRAPLFCALLSCILALGSSAQIGIKTRYPVQSGSLYQANSTYRESHYQNNNNLHHNFESTYVDENVKFLNETRSKMASGICFKEVPTSSLVHNPSAIPAGNGSDPTMSKIQVCCSGYERNVHNFYKCEPLCNDGCPNAMCVAPNTCVCFPGHVRNLAQFCIPTCPIGCGNGDCEADGFCKCKPGYVLDISKQFCIPACSHGCSNGNCTAPEVCQCNEGYQFNEEYGKCEPKCNNCDFGKCISPGVCTCNSGFKRVGDRCEPVCSLGCNKGICTAPETCSCRTGFELDKTGTNCIPHCEKPCINGFCDGHNVCSCNTGYILDEVSTNMCKPHCPQGCPNGYCTSPNFCVCKYGFIKSGVKGRQQCTPTS